MRDTRESKHERCFESQVARLPVTYLQSWICNTEIFLLVDSNIRCLKLLFLTLNLIHNFFDTQDGGEKKRARRALEMVGLSHIVFVWFLGVPGNDVELSWVGGMVILRPPSWQPSGLSGARSQSFPRQFWILRRRHQFRLQRTSHPMSSMSVWTFQRQSGR